MMLENAVHLTWSAMSVEQHSVWRWAPFITDGLIASRPERKHPRSYIRPEQYCFFTPGLHIRYFPCSRRLAELDFSRNFTISLRRFRSLHSRHSPILLSGWS